jgi:hypothetical protein
MRRLAIVLGMTLFFVAWINFSVFWIVALIIGGDAINGKAEDGSFYLGSHGRYTQVSQDIYIYSRTHAISVFITHPVGIFGGGALFAYGARRQPKT